MISSPSKLSQIIYDEAASLVYHPQVSRQQLNGLRKQLAFFPSIFQTFREQMIGSVRQWMNQIYVIVCRQAKEKLCLQLQLQKSKQVQQTMRKEVMQLKEMINEAMLGYSQQLQCKNNEIRNLKALLEKNMNPVLSQEIKIEEQSKNEIDLEIIQQESEQATFSSARTLREFKDSARQSFQAEKSVCRESSQETETFISPKPLLQPQKHESCDFSRNQQNSRAQHKRTKSFIDNFRKTIEQSFMQKQSDISKSYGSQETYSNIKEDMFRSQEQVTTQNYRIYRAVTSSVPLRQITNTPYTSNNFNYNTMVSSVTKENEGGGRPKMRIMFDQTRQISCRSSLNSGNRGVEEESTQILPIKKFQTPTNASLFKKKQNHQRMMTEPSPQRTKPSQNYFASTTFQTATHARRSSQRNTSHDEVKTTKNVSKEKIKVTSRLVEEMNQAKRNPISNNNKAVVYLGGKCFFRKFLLQLKEAFRKYVIDAGVSSDEVKYQGDKRNKMRWGKGRLFYRNGMIYQGDFRENVRHGRGSLYMNGISIYEGEWVGDNLQGQGYLKSMKHMSKECPLIFSQSSFCGNLFENRLHGIGTIFLNQREKIVTKFSYGLPVGELTYYNLNEIEFGVWPAQ